MYAIHIFPEKEKECDNKNKKGTGDKLSLALVVNPQCAIKTAWGRKTDCSWQMSQNILGNEDWGWGNAS